MDEPANPSQALACVLIDELARGGITDAVVAPGSRSTALAMAIHADHRLRLHVQVDERSAGFLAVGMARITRRPAVVVTTSGGAAANLHPAVVEADTAGVPLLVLTADRPPELRATGANQAIDQLKLYGQAVRWFCEVGVAVDHPGVVAMWRSTACRALAETGGLSGRPGPVHLNLAFREPTVPASDDGRTASAPFAQPLDGAPGGASWSRPCVGARTLGSDQLAVTADRLAAAARGLLVVGDTTADPHAVAALAAATGWPVIAEPASGARTVDHVIAHAPVLLEVPGFLDAHRPELVVRIGRPTVARAVLAALGRHVAICDAWDDPTRSTAELLVADATHTCLALAERLAPEARTAAWTARWRAADAAAERAIAALLAAEDAPNEPAVARAAVASVPDGGALVVASSMPIRDVDAWAPARGGIRVVANRGASGIDGFVSTALGVALASAGPTVALTGDLSFLHDRNGLLVRSDGPDPDVVFVVVDNDGGGIFHFLPQAGFPDSFERIFGTPHGTDIPALAGAHGLTCVQPPADRIAAEVADRATAGGAHVVHVRTDRHANVALHRRLREAVAGALPA